jgi:hypothetical protein
VTALEREETPGSDRHNRFKSERHCKPFDGEFDGCRPDMFPHPKIEPGHT